MRRIRLGVNVDHVATIRQQRDTRYPDPVFAASMAELAGADQITVHLREDRRHIQDRDVTILRQTCQTLLNLEMAATGAMIKIALDVRPDTVTLVPEKREERTTEGGLDVVGCRQALQPVVAELREAGITVSLFIDPDEAQVDASGELGAHAVELHTGDYCDAGSASVRASELRHLQQAAKRAAKAGLGVVAGHGLDYVNVREVCAIPEIEEVNIGHALVARAILVGFPQAVADMIHILREAEV